MNVNTRQLRALQQVARLKSFTRAAEHLHLTQAGLSAMIRELESQLGTRVFDRTTRSVTLTEAGTTLLGATGRMLEEFDSAVAAISSATSSSRRVLSVAATPFISSTLLPAACVRFRDLRPDVTVAIRDCVHNEVRDAVESGESDLGFGMFFKSAAGLERLPIHDFDFVHVSQATRALTRDALRAAWRHPMPWSELKSARMIGLPPENPIQRLVDVQLRSVNSAGDERMHFNSFHTVLAMIRAGAGAAVLPAFVASACVGERVQLRPMHRPKISVQLFRISKKGRAMAESADDFTKAVSEVIDESGPG